MHNFRRVLARGMYSTRLSRLHGRSAPKGLELVFGERLTETLEKGAESVVVAPEVWPAPPRGSAESHCGTGFGAASSNKTLSGYLRSRPSGSVTNFPAFFFVSSFCSRRAAHLFYLATLSLSLFLPLRDDDLRSRRTRALRDSPSVGFCLIFVLIKRGRVSTWQKLIGAPLYPRGEFHGSSRSGRQRRED